MDATSDNVKNENKKVYASEAATYDLLHPEVWNWYEQRRYRRLVQKTLRLLPQRSEARVILDVGAGTGNLALKYLAAGCHVISVDISAQMLSVLEKKLSQDQKQRSTIICADIESFSPRLSALDGICFSSVLHHLYDYEAVIQELVEKIRPGGFFFNVHDPLIQQPKSQLIFKIHRFLGNLDERLYRLNAKRCGYSLEDFPDDTVAEYHQRAGTMKHEELRLFLERIGLSIVNFETYVSRRYGFFSWLATEVIRSENSFTYIARKPLR